MRGRQAQTSTWLVSVCVLLLALPSQGFLFFNYFSPNTRNTLLDVANKVIDTVKTSTQDKTDKASVALNTLANKAETVVDRIQDKPYVYSDAKIEANCLRCRDSTIAKGTPSNPFVCSHTGKTFNSFDCNMCELGRAPSCYNKCPCTPKDNFAQTYWNGVPMERSDDPVDVPYEMEGVDFSIDPGCDAYTAKDVLSKAGGFDPTATTTWSPRNHYLFTFLSWATSKMPDFPDQITSRLECMGAREVNYIETALDNEALVLRTDISVLVVLEGSKSVSDWFNNILIAQTTTSFYGGVTKVHRGWHSAVLDLVQKSDLLPTISKYCKDLGAEARTCPVYVSGFSRGGALATLISSYLRQRGFNIQAVYVHGSPRVGFDTFTQRYALQGLNARTFRLVYKDDIAANLPLKFTGGYQDVGTLVSAEDCGPSTTTKRTYVDAFDHNVEHYMNALYMRCPMGATGAAFKTDILPSPPFPNGRNGKIPTVINLPVA
eukprot:comp16579_c0_seq1/m.14693 comp16579_c0_seq1/g.14693  ORF comp16579_c0_seq1/g.14693 comp16579_c0_seq1/m.14693 type:complete len:489 (-) comp16579_c0_seq1:660-2126(-)